MDAKSVGEDIKNLLTAAAYCVILKQLQTGGVFMVKHWVYYPRNFGNEYDVIRTENASEERDLFDWYNNLNSDSANHSLDRVSLKALSRMCAAERYERKHNQAFSGYCSPWEVQSVGEFLCPRF